MNEWIVRKILNWDQREENNQFLDYLNSFGNEKISFVQLRTGICFNNIHLTQKEKLKCIDIILEEYNKCKCLQDLDNIIQILLVKENRRDMENYIIYHLENLYNDSLTLKNQGDLTKNSMEEDMILTRSLYLARESLPCAK